MDKQQIVSFINENMFGIWFLIGAALVFPATRSVMVTARQLTP